VPSLSRSEPIDFFKPCNQDNGKYNQKCHDDLKGPRTVRPRNAVHVGPNDPVNRVSARSSAASVNSTQRAVRLAVPPYGDHAALVTNMLIKTPLFFVIAQKCANGIGWNQAFICLNKVLFSAPISAKLSRSIVPGTIGSFFSE